MQKLTKSEEGYTMKAAKCTWLQKKLDNINTQIIDAYAHQKVDLQIQDKLAKAHTQRVDHAKDLKELDTAQIEIIQLRKQLVEVQKINKSGATLVAITTALNYWPHGIGPKKQLTGKDKAMYKSWIQAIKEKLETNCVMYKNNKERVIYILSIMTAVIFKRIAAWTQANSETLTIEQLFEKVKHYMGLHFVSAEAKKELNKIIMKHTKSVNEFYHWIFEL